MTNRPMTFSSLNWGKKWVSLFPNKLGKNHICLSTLSQNAQKTQIAQFFCALWVKASQVPQPTLRCGLGLQYPYRRGIFLCSPVALPILAEHGQMDAYWVREHLRKLQPQSHFCSLTGLGSSTPFLSSASLQLLPETDVSLLLSWICHFQLSVFPPPVFNFC